MVALILFGTATTAGAQPAQDVPPPDGREPFAIVDNSFLVEEAFNQDSHVVQNIFGWTRDHGEWQGNFTQEWPVSGIAHQLSYTIPFSGGSSSTHLDLVLLNYRYQVTQDGPGRVGFSPRISLILPTGRHHDPADRPGAQINLPFSKQTGDVYFHWNAGVTWINGAELSDGTRSGLTSPFLAASAIWRTTPLLHLMLESLITWEDTILDSPGTRRFSTWTVLPGFRRGWNVGDRQVVIGLGLPVTRAEATTSVGALTYFSYELPFGKP